MLESYSASSTDITFDIWYHIEILAYLGTAGLSQAQPMTPRRYLAYLAAFSRKHSLKQVYEFLTTRLRINRDDMRLWKFKDEVRIYTVMITIDCFPLSYL